MKRDCVSQSPVFAGGPVKRGMSCLRDKRGGATLEFVLWFPIFMGLIAMIADLSIIFTTNANMWDVARDTARRMAVNNFDADEAEAFARSAMVLGRPGDYTVIATYGSDVTVQITTSTADASVFGIYAAVMPGTLTARVTMMKEPE